MFCDVCKTKEATVFLTQIVEGKMEKVNLCETCSKEKGVNDPTGFALADLLLGLGAAQEIENSPAGIRCPVCGFSQNDFKKTGRLGCSACYDAFAEGLSGMLKNMHRGVVHTGKVPAKLAVARRRSHALAELEANLASAITQEHFEEAAKLRDKIRRLELDSTSTAETVEAHRTAERSESSEDVVSIEAGTSTPPKPRKKS